MTAVKCRWCCYYLEWWWFFQGPFCLCAHNWVHLGLGCAVEVDESRNAGACKSLALVGMSQVTFAVLRLLIVSIQTQDTDFLLRSWDQKLCLVSAPQCFSRSICLDCGVRLFLFSATLCFDTSTIRLKAFSFPVLRTFIPMEEIFVLYVCIDLRDDYLCFSDFLQPHPSWLLNNFSHLILAN